MKRAPLLPRCAMAAPIIAVASLVLAALWELWRPRRQCRFAALRRRVGNIGFWLVNSTLGALIFAAPDDLRSPWPLSGPASLLAWFLLMDAMLYGVHRLYHAVPLLWRLHALHHSDPDVDWSTAVRHHPAEYLSAMAVYWIAIVSIGIPGPVVAFQGVCAFVGAVAVHGAVRWPPWLERLLQPVIVTPDLHLVHHSADPAHANANFGHVLSIWDRLFNTFTSLPREPVDRLGCGVRELDPAEACRPLHMLLTPWRI